MHTSNMPVNIFWFRRDLRLHDHAGLYHALREGRPVLPIFIFDRNILGKLEDKEDRRVVFIHRAVQAIQHKLTSFGASMEFFYGHPLEVFRTLLERYQIEKVFANRDYEPYALDRDREVAELLQEHGVAWADFKDQVIFDRSEIVKDDGKPYTVFTPYSRKWKSAQSSNHVKSYPVSQYFSSFLQRPPADIPALEAMGFSDPGYVFPSGEADDSLVSTYDKVRDFPALRGTTRLGVHLRFGTISIRELARKACELNETFLNELIWREFYHMILWHFPKVGKGQCFKPEYEEIRWRNNEKEFEKWQTGQTGYPIVDAGMRELNSTGFMHNRVRMITASFLAKHLLIDWRWGEAYLAAKLLDFDLAANNGGWQWAAGCGCDAAPYFRIFNPALQTRKFDGQHEYIRKWVPEFDQLTYAQPVVPHEFARSRCLEAYSAALKKQIR